MAFVRVPGNPEPDGAEEIWFEGRGGLKLRAVCAPSAQRPPRGSVILCNGRTEFIEKYFELIRWFQARGFAVLTLDWRGQGLSDRHLPNPLKGHLESLDDPVSDLAALLKLAADKLPRPHLLVAHSMGGGIALRALQTRRIEVEAAIFSAPMWGIAGLKNWQKRFARFMTAIGAGTSFAPGAARTWKKEPFKRNPVTHDRERYARAQALVMAEPRLALAGVTLGWVNAAVTAFEGFDQPGALAHLRMPIVIASAGEESIVDNSAHDVIAKLLVHGEHIVIPGAKHEILHETDDVRARWLEAFDRLAATVAPQRTPGPVAA
jgi:lysophospholipase